MKLKSELKYNRDLQIILVAVLFYASACLGYFLAFEKTSEMPVWPPSGIAFALILLLGTQVWPGIMIGSLIAGIMANWNNAMLPVQSLIAVSSFTAVAHTFEALVGNWLVKNWIKDDYPFKTSAGAFQFLFVVFVMCVAGALIGTSVMYTHQILAVGDLIKAGTYWVVGNSVGILLFTPLILSFARQDLGLSIKKVIEISLFLLAMAGVVFLLQTDTFTDTTQRALPFLILPFFLWLAFRFQLTVATCGVLMVSLVAIYFTVENQGPFVLAEPHYSMVLLQIFMCVVSISTLVLSATVYERTVAQRTLLEFNENLEAKVLERTHALHEEIATRKEAEAKLQKSNQELSKRNTELDNFVYSVSHDLRAPIASVLGLINLARKDTDAATKDTYLEMINNSALQQDHFIKEILDQSRNSRLDVKREEILFRPIIDETFNQLRFATPTGKAVEKVISVQQDGPFYCDRWRLKVILNNIISNAIRYRNGRDPVIKVNVNVTHNAADLCIEDNGKGIAKEHIKNVCRMFYRATDDNAGSGLGLYIVKETIDKLNGSIDIDSVEGLGTTVRLRIPEVTPG